jgi:hypothetical protein
VPPAPLKGNERSGPGPSAKTCSRDGSESDVEEGFRPEMALKAGQAVMKLLAMALAVSMAMGAILFIVGSGSGANVEVAGAVGAMPLVAVPHIYDTLERVEARKSITSGHKIMIPTFEGFSVSWPIMVAAGSIVVFVITLFTGVIVGGIAHACKVPGRSVMGTVGLISFLQLISLPLQLTIGYVLGKWIGARSARNGIGAVLLVAALGPIGTKLLDYMVLSADEGARSMDTRQPPHS